MAKHLTIYDFRDVDLMMKLSSEMSDEGEGIPSDEFADSLGMSRDVQAVSQRCSWMVRYGFFQFDKEKRLWTLSPAGERIVKAQELASGIDELAALDDEAMVDVMAHVTSRYRYGDRVTATLLRREFVHGTSPRSSAWSGTRKSKRRAA